MGWLLRPDLARKAMDDSAATKMLQTLWSGAFPDPFVCLLVCSFRFVSRYGSWWYCLADGKFTYETG